MLTVFQFLSWKIAYKSNFEVNLACQALDLPLRFLLDILKDSNDWVIKGGFVHSCTEARILNKYSSIMVKFGELKSTRQNNVGTLAIVSDPKKVVSLVKGREYQ